MNIRYDSIIVNIYIYVFLIYVYYTNKYMIYYSFFRYVLKFESNFRSAEELVRN